MTLKHTMALGADFISDVLGDPKKVASHYGTLGMRWGVRNDDRSSGRPQGGASKKKAPRSSIKKLVSSKSKTSGTKTKVEPNSSADQTSITTTKPVVTRNAMSDNELRDAINRLQMEKTYRQLMLEQNPAPAKKAPSVVKRILGDAAKGAAGEILKSTATAVGKYAIAAAISKKNPALASAILKNDSWSEKKDKKPDSSPAQKQPSQNGSSQSTTTTSTTGKTPSDATQKIIDELAAARNK